MAYAITTNPIESVETQPSTDAPDSPKLAPDSVVEQKTSNVSNERSENTYHVTGYNLFSSQTDDTPCIGASGKDLCKIPYKTAACPRKMPLGTKVRIDGEVYTCEDRLAMKYDNRIDINCKFDTQCPYNVTGYYEVEIL